MMCVFGVGPPDVIFSTPRHLRLADNLVLEYEYYGCGLYPDVRGVAKDVVEGELHATHCRCCSLGRHCERKS